ncbi:MAG: hypothetical protein EP319_09715 [Deltaproteobacteria bacterium]|nr:MAG: hypothetical protein EP319_09715 [Deltaproteobacteria bacterium]
MGKWSLSRLLLPLRVTWKISRNSSTEKTNFIIRFEQDGFEGSGETAFNVRYGESVNSIEESFNIFSTKVQDQNFDDFSAFSRFLDSLTLPNSLRFGIECSWLDWLSKKKGISKATILNIDSLKEVKTSFSIPILEVHEVDEYIQKFQLERFSSIKLKVSGVESLPLTLKVFESTKSGIRIDGNEGFSSADELKGFLDELPAERIEFVEQPLPSSMNREQGLLKGKYPFPFIADESLTNESISPELADCFDAVNIKLMKSGSILHALEQKKQAQDLGLKLMLGCMVETSLAISYGILLGKDVSWFDLDGFLLLEKDPFDLVEESNGILRSKV